MQADAMHKKSSKWSCASVCTAMLSFETLCPEKKQKPFVPDAVFCTQKHRYAVFCLVQGADGCFDGLHGPVDVRVLALDRLEDQHRGRHLIVEFSDRDLLP